jgi:hypothetical protein
LKNNTTTTKPIAIMEKEMPSKENPDKKLPESSLLRNPYPTTKHAHTPKGPDTSAMEDGA